MKDRTRNYLQKWISVINLRFSQKIWLFILIPFLLSIWMIESHAVQDSQTKAYQDYSSMSPAVLAGQLVYLQEGCQNCHTLNLQPFASEYTRFAPEEEDERLPSLLKKQDIQYETPVNLGTRRIGPDLSRIHGRLSKEELKIMLTLKNKGLKSKSHPYKFLFEQKINPLEISWKIRLLMQTTPRAYLSDSDQRSVFHILKDISRGDALILYLLSRGESSFKNERNFYTR